MQKEEWRKVETDIYEVEFKCKITEKNIEEKQIEPIGKVYYADIKRECDFILTLDIDKYDLLEAIRRLTMMITEGIFKTPKEEEIDKKDIYEQILDFLFLIVKKIPETKPLDGLKIIQKDNRISMEIRLVDPYRKRVLKAIDYLRKKRILKWFSYTEGLYGEVDISARVDRDEKKIRKVLKEIIREMAGYGIKEDGIKKFLSSKVLYNHRCYDPKVLSINPLKIEAKCEGQGSYCSLAKYFIDEISKCYLHIDTEHCFLDGKYEEFIIDKVAKMIVEEGRNLIERGEKLNFSKLWYFNMARYNKEFLNEDFCKLNDPGCWNVTLGTPREQPCEDCGYPECNDVDTISKIVINCDCYILPCFKGFATLIPDIQPEWVAISLSYINSLYVPPEHAWYDVFLFHTPEYPFCFEDSFYPLKHFVLVNDVLKIYDRISDKVMKNIFYTVDEYAIMFLRGTTF